jgi:hypothetical protein
MDAAISATPASSRLQPRADSCGSTDADAIAPVESESIRCGVRLSALPARRAGADPRRSMGIPDHRRRYRHSRGSSRRARRCRFVSARGAVHPSHGGRLPDAVLISAGLEPGRFGAEEAKRGSQAGSRAARLLKRRARTGTQRGAPTSRLHRPRRRLVSRIRCARRPRRTRPASSIRAASAASQFAPRQLPRR